jgi:formylmethanofuran dehydrogenase subunit E
MSEGLSIGSCEVCKKVLVPEDFNLHGAVRLPDDRVICKPCAEKAQNAALRSSQVPRRGDTGIFHISELKAQEGPRNINVGCMECGESFEAILEGDSRYIFCPKCGKKMRMETK